MRIWNYKLFFLCPLEQTIGVLLYCTDTSIYYKHNLLCIIIKELRGKQVREQWWFLKFKILKRAVYNYMFYKMDTGKLVKMKNKHSKFNWTTF